MATIRMLFRLFRLFSMLYTTWRALMESRWLLALLAIWRLSRSGPRRLPKRVAEFQVVNAGEPAIYRRVGWRKPVVRLLKTRKIL